MFFRSLVHESDGVRKMEFFDVVDEIGNPTGEVKERTAVHRDGTLHRTAHVWIGRRQPETGKIQVLLQKRSACKDSYPGCYDISSAGHIPAGVDYLPSALRELKEELGIQAAAEDLRFLFYHKGYCEDIFYGEMFRNYEYSAIYLYIKPVEADNLVLQKEEVESVKWFDYEEVLPDVAGKSREYCIYPDEFEKLGEYLEMYL